MCSATVGATAVKRCTVAASSTFSSGVLGTPCCGNTLNRVPEFAYAQEAVSTRCCRRASRTRVRVAGEGVAGEGVAGEGSVMAVSNRVNGHGSAGDAGQAAGQPV